jgi:hypothetical protein
MLRIRRLAGRERLRRHLEPAAGVVEIHQISGVAMDIDIDSVTPSGRKIALMRTGG